MPKKTNLLNREDKLSEIFLENTKIFFPEDSDEYDPKNFPKEWKKAYFKSYPRFKRIKLPKLSEIPTTLDDVLKNRKSIREFSKEPLSLKEISTLLFYSSGIIHKGETWDESSRPYPSAGARYPLEIYPVMLNSKEINNGIYHYNLKEHSLECISEGDYKDKLFEYTNWQEMVKNASMVLLISAVFKRTEMKYGDRGYRYVFLDAGHMTQNIYLVSTSIEVGCCTIGGFLDDEINKLLDLDGVNESVIYIAVIGKKKQ